MRPPERHDRNRRRRPRHDVIRRRRVIGVVVLVVLFFLITSLRGIAGFFTDYLWFKSLHQSGVWSGVLGAKVVLAIVFIGVAFLLLYLNLWISDRTAPAFALASTTDEVVLRFHEALGHRRGLVRAGVSFVLALLVGAGAASKWNEWILFTHRVDFGQTDATFGRDLGFYVFQLPFWEFLASWLFAALLVTLLITLVNDYFNGSIQIQAPEGTRLAERFSQRVKVHASVLLGMMALVKTAQYFLARFQLVFSNRGTVDGALYTDSNVQLKAIDLLLLISVFAAVLFLVNIWRKGWVLPAMAVGLWAVVSVIGGVAVPAFVQRFRVQPAESTMEKPYLSQNIKATRASFGLDKVEVKPFLNDGKLDTKTLNQNKPTVQNVRLWDPAVMREVFNKLQGIRSFYNVGDPDVDRYVIDGKLTQVLTANRDLDTSELPQKSWESEHLAYTHGYGNVMAPTNASDRGQPVFANKDIPVVSDAKDTEVTQPSTYFGEGQTGYVITNSKRKEIDYTDDAGNTKFASYKGADGIKVGSGIGGFTRKAAVALRFADINPLISSNVVAKSKVLMYRDVRQRVQTLAPFLSFDADPYVVVRADGRMDYIIDGYTTSAHYPNAQRAITSDLANTSGLNRRLNYVRNSVKAVVDAYDGTVTMYVIDPEDPIITSYEQAFPKLFTAKSKIPEDLSIHFRYPEDLFKVQTRMYGRYHLTDPSGFYTQENAWQISADPNRAGVASDQAPGAVDANGNPIDSNAHPMDPYYLLMRQPGDAEESFLMLRPFVPKQSSELNKQVLTGFMTAQSDPRDYGRLDLFQLPADNLPSGPYNVAAQMMQDAKVSSTQTLLCNAGGSSGGSECEYGNLLLMPIDQSLLYVRPWYVKSSGNSLPELQRVIVAYQDQSGNLRVAVNSTLKQALTDLFGQGVPDTDETNPVASIDTALSGQGSQAAQGSGSTTTTTPSSGPTTTTKPSDATAAQLIEQLNAAFAQADADLKKGDLEAYARDIAKAKSIAAQLQAKSAGN